MMVKKLSKNKDLTIPLDITLKMSYNKLYSMMMFNNNNEVKI